VPTPEEQITAVATSWPGVTSGVGRRGELAFRYERREIGHLHGSRVAHFGFPKAVWHELHAAGRITEHPVFPGQPGFGARAIRDDADVADVIALLRLNYDRVAAKSG
jgi:hypothetical protein